MKTYVALLRGINVSGQKKIKMAELKIHFEKQGFAEVQTYIQSGNIIFQSDLEKINDIETTIEALIYDEYGYEVTCVVKHPVEFKYVLENNPFLKDKSKNKDFFGLTFLSDIPDDMKVDEFKQFDFLPEEFVIDGKYIYLYAPNGFGRAKITNNLIERKLKVGATSRNWKTIGKLLELSHLQ